MQLLDYTIRLLGVSETIHRWHAAISALEEGEDHGLNEYRTRLPDLDTDTQDFIRARLVPAQTETHGIARALKFNLSQPSRS